MVVIWELEEIKPNKIYTPESIAKILGVSLSQMKRKKEIPFRCVQGKKFITGQGLLNWLNSSEVKVPIGAVFT